MYNTPDYNLDSHAAIMDLSRIESNVIYITSTWMLQEESLYTDARVFYLCFVKCIYCSYNSLSSDKNNKNHDEW